MKISVVIPTIGNRNLHKTLNSICNSSKKVDEIILSVPPGYKTFRNNFQAYKNLKIHISKTKGQVAQRIEGFIKAKNKFVMQMDDDIVLEKNCLRLMYDFINKNKTAAVSAHFHDIISKKSIYTNKKNLSYSNYFFLTELNFFKNNFISEVYNKIKFIDDKKQQGTISKSGFETYPNFNEHKEPFISGWIPGGCIMHHKTNLILSNFFPFKGKAYCEDLFHSIALKKNNIKLYYHPKAKAYLKIDSIKSKLFLKFLKDDFTVRKKLVKENKLSLKRMYLIYLIKFFSYIFK